MSKDDILLMVTLYGAWWMVCTAQIPIIRILRNVIIVICIGTLIANKFESGLLLFVVAAFHPIYVKMIFSTIRYYLISR